MTSALSVEIPDVLAKELLQWLDNMLLHCESIPNLLKTIRKSLRLCIHLILQLHPDRCLSFATQVRW